MAANENKANQPKTAFGRYMVYKFIPAYANNVSGVVYMGAAILIIIVGLRGLGKVAGELAIVPKFLLDAEGAKIDPNWVMLALFLEFFLLMILATVTFFTPEEAHGPGEETADEKPAVERPDFKKELEHLKNLTDEEVKMIETYLEKFESIQNKITQIQMNSMKALSSMKDTLKS
ncbi:MAG: hypothetical protein K9J16_05125 [Melioribacteraceae bacterium]|nr:hypothetical protein [Melioribacteraceae bacterium]MCF8354842.1 hypothetical protein [Melioribacteraceae bacterium]MCF8392949.1 hypothetical protein [Melioribacteraceae bacterium]MCF8417308.1 hypothetical protein [Melioribacteraceae bacterium]